MGILDFFSEPDCEETVAYTESLVEHVEFTLKNMLNLNIDQEVPTRNEVSVLLAYGLLRVSIAHDPNVNSDCQRQVGKILNATSLEWLTPPDPDWSSIDDDEDLTPREMTVTAITMGQTDYQSLHEIVTEYAASEIARDEEQFFAICGRLTEVEAAVLNTIHQHSRAGPQGTEEGLPFSIDEAEERADQLADKIRGHLESGRLEHGRERILPVDREIIIGLFHLAYVPCLCREAEAGEIHLSTALAALRGKLTDTGGELNSSLKPVEAWIRTESVDNSLSEEVLGETALNWALGYLSDNAGRRGFDPSSRSSRKSELRDLTDEVFSLVEA